MKKFLIITAAVLLGTICRAQNVSDLIISEICPDADSTGIIDTYGRRTGWIELLNKSQGTVNYSGCFLTNDKNDLHKSVIPTGDRRTRLQPRQVELFYTSADQSDGTFYTSFSVKRGETIYLVSNDGKTIIDSLSVPSDLPYGKSVSKIANDAKQMDFQVSQEPTKPTPMMQNGNTVSESKAHILAKTDPHGFTLALTAVIVVFSALAILWFLFSLFFSPKKKKEPKQPKSKASAKGMTPEIAAAIGMALDMENGGETYAAIATALHLYLGDSVHDNESFTITIQRKNSAWNDKTQNFRTSPRK